MSRFEFAKVDDEQRLVFGWQSVVVTKDGDTVVDSQGHIIEPDVLENAVYDFVLHIRDGSVMHERDEDKQPVVKSTLVESVVFTKEKMAAMGIPEGTIPEGWWAGFKVHDDAAWEGVKNGTYKAFSIAGRAIEVPVEEVS